MQVLGLIALFLVIYLSFATVLYSTIRHQSEGILGPPPPYWTGWIRYITFRYFRTGEWLWKALKH